MNRSSHTPISDELLSAYIDGLVTNEEKARVEADVAADPALAWELDSLRRTVELVRDLPPVPLPRSFALREEQVADVLAERRARRASPAAARPGPAVRPPVGIGSRSFWQEILAFFSSGNLLLRNATAVAALFLAIVLAATPPGSQARQTLAQSSATESSVAVSESPAPSEEAAAFASPAEPAPSQPESAAKVAPAAEEIAPAESESEVAAPMAEMAAPAPAQMQAEAVAMESVPPPSAMRSAPGGLDAPALAGPAGGMGGGFESGPMAMPVVPADMAPVSESPFPTTGVGVLPRDGGPQYSIKLPVESEASAPAVAESAADSPVVEEDAALDSAANEPAAKQAETPAQEKILDEPAPQEPVQSGWSTWRLAQAVLGGLVLLLGIFWLRSRQPSP